VKNVSRITHSVLRKSEFINIKKGSKAARVGWGLNKKREKAGISASPQGSDATFSS